MKHIPLTLARVVRLCAAIDSNDTDRIRRLSAEVMRDMGVTIKEAQQLTLCGQLDEVKNGQF